MKVFKLPDDITSSDNKSNSIIFHNYSAPIGTFNGKSVLNKNAISLVISGEKTMYFAEKVVNMNMLILVLSATLHRLVWNKVWKRWLLFLLNISRTKTTNFQQQLSSCCDKM